MFFSEVKRAEMKINRRKVYGVGTNDAKYTVTKNIMRNGRHSTVITCNYYSVWNGMLRRCYSDEWRIRNQSYVGCSVDNEWHLFSNFKAWMEQQDWEGKHLDKDIILIDNKIYSPATAAFVLPLTNSFVTDCRKARGRWPVGVSWKKKNRKFQASCQNPFTGKNEYIGLFDNPDDAHLAWRAVKHEWATKIAEKETDPRIKQALRTRYST